VQVISEDREVVRTIADLKYPIVAPCATAAAIATHGGIEHMPGYDGAILWFDAAAKSVRTIYPHEVDVVATDCKRVYAAKGRRLFALAL
jgi:hypothetical protein